MYLILFLIVGSCIQVIIKDESNRMIAVVTIACLWALAQGPFWGIVSGLEIVAGILLTQKLRCEKV